jgi:hypothetical protein
MSKLLRPGDVKLVRLSPNQPTPSEPRSGQKTDAGLSLAVVERAGCARILATRVDIIAIASRSGSRSAAEARPGRANVQSTD